MITDNDEFFMIFYYHLLLIEEISFVHYANIFTAQNQCDNV